jgi:hypothetical protein
MTGDGSVRLWARSQVVHTRCEPLRSPASERVEYGLPTKEGTVLHLVLALAACDRPDEPTKPTDGGPTDGPVVDTADTDTNTGTAPTDTGTAPVGPTFTASLSDTNLITLSWSIPGVDPAGEVYVFDLGLQPAVCDGGPAEGCTVTTRVEDGAIHEFTLRVPAQGEPATYLSAQVEVIPPAPPVLIAEPAVPPLSYEGNTVVLDMLAPVEVTLRWDESARPAGTFLRLRTPETSVFSDGGEVALADSLVVPASELDLLGTSTWTLEACTLPSGADVALCSQETPLSLRVVAGLLEGRRVQAGPADHTLDWQSGGNLFYLTSSRPWRDGIPAWDMGF